MIRFLRLLPSLLIALGLAGAAAAQNYRIEEGDVLRVEVIEDESLNRSVLVAPDGRITFPLIGAIQAAGRTLGAVQSDLTSSLAPNFSAEPNVFVSLEQQAEEPPAVPRQPAPEPTVAIYTMGEVAKVGRIELEPGTTLLQAFAAMGGFSDFAAKRRIQLRRPDPQTGAERIYSLNYEAIMSGRSPNGSVVMQEGDVILVPTRRLFE